MLRIEQLEYFETVAKRRSLSLASKQLHLTPQALSAAIRTLEKELGLILINRSHNGITLTREGQIVASLAHEILERAEEMRNIKIMSQENTVKTLHGSLRIKATPLICDFFVNSTIKNFLKKYPCVSTTLQECSISSLVDCLPAKQFDLAILHIPQNRLPLLLQHQENFSFDRIFFSKLAIACSRKHPLAEKRMVSWKMICKYPLSMVDENNLIDLGLSESVQRHGKPTTVAIFSNINLCTDSLKDGQSIALTLQNRQQYLPEPLRNEFCCIPLRENILISGLIIRDRRKPLSETAQLYADMLKDFIF